MFLSHRCLQASSADDKFADYQPTTAFLFPGQGAQTVGMAKVCIQLEVLAELEQIESL